MLVIYIIVIFITLLAMSITIHVMKPEKHTQLVRYKPTDQYIRSYLNALYPNGSIYNISSEYVKKLYDSLKWYYLPLPKEVNKNRYKAISGPYYNAETQWFMADGTDCGDPSDKGEFTCSVFGGACKTWEFGNGHDGGRPYQAIAFIEPYNNRGGTPSNAYIECVAFVCEALGRMLLTDKCNYKAPTWQQFLNNDNAGKTKDWATIEHYQSRHCSNKSDCDGNDPGCKIKSGSMTDTCCWNFKNGKADSSSCEWPSSCMATSDNGKVYDNFCGVPCGYTGCDVTKDCHWTIDGEKWSDWLKKQTSDSYNKSKYITEKLQYSHPFNKPWFKSESHSIPRRDISLSKTMFYWCKGYGKFLNMGKTGVYFNYFHYLLTCPKLASDGKTPIRWSFPQILQTATMSGGNRGLLSQFIDLSSGRYYDQREYLEGFVTTLRGKEYEGYGHGVRQVPNKMPFKTENVNGLYNPLDDDNLKTVDKLTITKYYPPENNIKNPQYRKKIQFTPYETCYLMQGMHIYGATANSTKHPFVTLSGRKQGGYGSGIYPFGVHFAGSNLGHCVYQLTALCGWNSTQFTQMPTGAGGKKYCNSPEYDYEIVYIHDKEWVCNTGFKLLDPTADIDNYIKYGFVNGNTPNLNVEKFTPTKMKLTERNVPDNWLGPKPNETLYKLPKKPVPNYTKCPYTDQVFSKYKN